jgi:hypothetical protein
MNRLLSVVLGFGAGAVADPVLAEGGNITVFNGWVYHVFTTSGTFTPLGAPGTTVSNCQVLACGGGGPGGQVGNNTSGRAGGGGGGALLKFDTVGNSFTFTDANTVTIGAGGLYNTTTPVAAGGTTSVETDQGTLQLGGGGAGGRNYFGSLDVAGAVGATPRGNGGGGCNAATGSTTPTSGGLGGGGNILSGVITNPVAKNGGLGGSDTGGSQADNYAGGGASSEANGYAHDAADPHKGEGATGYPIPTDLLSLDDFAGMTHLCSGGGCSGAASSSLYPGSPGGPGAGGGRHFDTDRDPNPTSYGSGGGAGTRNSNQAGAAGGPGFKGVVVIRYPA